MYIYIDWAYYIVFLKQYVNYIGVSLILLHVLEDLFLTATFFNITSIHHDSEPDPLIGLFDLFLNLRRFNGNCEPNDISGYKCSKSTLHANNFNLIIFWADSRLKLPKISRHSKFKKCKKAQKVFKKTSITIVV